MSAHRSIFRTVVAVLWMGMGVATLFVRPTLAAAKPPAVGDAAADFKLATVDGEEVQLSKLVGKGPVVLVVLRGYPGYQCPICTRQVGELMAAAGKFKEQGASVVLVYPGPSAQLKERASEFISGKALPAGFQLLLDPDYAFTNAYRLRWEAKNETAYPSTFVIGRDGRIRFAKVSMTHGGRAGVGEILGALMGL